MVPRATRDMNAMDAYVISLKRTPERLRSFNSRNGSHVSCQLFPAIDGSRLGALELSISDYFKDVTKFKGGEIGNALSHMKLWEQVVQTGVPALICEDDALLHSNFSSISSRLIDALGVDWDYVTWGWNFDSILSGAFVPALSPFVAIFDQNVMRLNAAEYLKSDISPSLLAFHNGFGTLCYTISPRGAEKFLGLVKPMRLEDVFIPGFNRHVMSRTLDILMNKYYKDLKCFVSFPPLAVTMNDRSRSTVVLR